MSLIRENCFRETLQITRSAKIVCLENLVLYSILTCNSGCNSRFSFSMAVLRAFTSWHILRYSSESTSTAPSNSLIPAGTERHIMSLLERCPHFRGCYVQSSTELGPEDVSLLERCPHFRGCYDSLQWSWDLKMCPY